MRRSLLLLAGSLATAWASPLNQRRCGHGGSNGHGYGHDNDSGNGGNNGTAGGGGNGGGNGNGNCSCNCSGGGDGGFTRTLPNTVVLDGQRLVDNVPKVAAGQYTTELNAILEQADSYMGVGPWTVVSKSMAVPNGTNHDYASQAPYWWPANWNDTSNPNVCPYVQRDGIRNPEVDRYTDRRDGAAMMTSTYWLSLAWWYTNDARYRVQAANVLRTWFLNNGTRMTPHLEHAQILPCRNSGRAIGIIDFSQQYTDVIDAVALLNTAHDVSWNATHAAAFESWNRDFLGWLTTSEFGKAELAAKNNHGTFAAMQIAALSAWLGDKETAKTHLEGEKARISRYITANGSQPLETVRPTSFHYTTFTLVAYCRMVAIGQHSGIDVDLWNYAGPEGQSIPKAIEYLLPAAGGTQADWPHPDSKFQRFAAYDIVHFAADQGVAAATAILDKLEQPPPSGGSWALAPAVQQLDSILLG